MRSTAQNSQLKFWTREFGNNYINRNLDTARKLNAGVRAYQKIFDHVNISSILEVGSNIGLNLVVINKIFKGKVKLFAVEPNKKAFSYLTKRKDMKLTDAWVSDAAHIPLENNSIDLVFTSGVLIHIAPRNLLAATKEIVRVSGHYVLCIEYFSHKPVDVPYRNYDGVLFKRDFGAYYLDHFPNLKVLSYGFLWQRDLPIFDNLNWWLFEKKHRN
ncbi:MAG: Pseudaminic acid biosynthesis-associated methylase [Candidatus Curtissbacteria bacterium GW2011_GWA1_40_47]|uniref:Methyltransferase type 11 domain-containing protein n=1 Tax=Candidatus Curtissbacteria bacterium RIFOXYA1_FULL_41_14 TaxID=1797737 RepID=A0A1F5HB14_9BACT|nr:MAG: Pseudaminic acid biosynthesis-associated methylase [Candidatus Curtissbacteria bacterium GW2011_GWB1_40_28]KKR62358.1 MAG: Pseudaminic acid biosynthesis-associated methylase [Microgenomates group bacterium GW2011_GWC1_40_35]KKR66441.1 MAG: Pseudaminic acid biosynthesis-associated methylase [Candidatus Curtissbacteria bacterium GW2011_GWA1_40_47]KKR77899.1 MAG: Pseudaminic acid biosynthesis-associated methylase [Candidatus Curtissbacteria bacterium GW2011_GWD1_40_8]KKS02526.1 MAG: Pseuda